MQHSRNKASPKSPKELQHTALNPDEAMAHIRKKYPSLKQDQIEQVHERLMYYAHGTPNGVTKHIMDTVEGHAARYHKLNTTREKLPYK